MKPIGLMAIDLDGVLLKDDSSWEIFHRLLGTIGAKRDRNMEDFFSGKIDYLEWARRDTSMWEGMSIEPVHRYLARIDLNEGAEDLVQSLRALGVLPVIISTGISVVVKRAGEILGIDLVESNHVEVLDGRITGRVDVRCGFDEKGSVIRRLAGEASIPLDRCAAIGDAENDISMFETVPFSIAYNPKSPRVAQAATKTIVGTDLLEARDLLVDHFSKIRKCTPSLS
jgi:phosphoserine phosphatase